MPSATLCNPRLHRSPPRAPTRKNLKKSQEIRTPAFRLIRSRTTAGNNKNQPESLISSNELPRQVSDQGIKQGIKQASASEPSNQASKKQSSSSIAGKPATKATTKKQKPKEEDGRMRAHACNIARYSPFLLFF